MDARAKYEPLHKLVSRIVVAVGVVVVVAAVEIQTTNSSYKIKCSLDNSLNCMYTPGEIKCVQGTPRVFIQQTCFRILNNILYIYIYIYI